MTTHRASYPHLANDSIFHTIQSVEESLATRSIYYIPQSEIRNHQSAFHNGDIIAITSDNEGLDVSHTGIAIRMDDGLIHYMHAPDSGDVVKITDVPLSKYIEHSRHNTGVVIIRAIDPQ
jgi:hypothetical protein